MLLQEINRAVLGFITKTEAIFWKFLGFFYHVTASAFNKYLMRLRDYPYQKKNMTGLLRETVAVVSSVYIFAGVFFPEEKILGQLLELRHYDLILMTLFRDFTISSHNFTFTLLP